MIRTTKDFQDEYLDKYGSGDITKMMIEFAKMHVELALEAAAENVELKDYYEYQYGGGYEKKQEIDKNSILNAYFYDNIQ